jgi:predicted nucleic acid-binding Zn ribbon protein
MKVGVEVNMEKNGSSDDTKTKSTFAFECDGCGEAFESLQRLRQHEVDCKSDETEDWL